MALLRWLDQGAPSRADRTKVTPGKTSARGGLETTPKRLARVLERGLASLPLDEQQRERALALA